MVSLNPLFRHMKRFGYPIIIVVLSIIICTLLLTRRTTSPELILESQRLHECSQDSIERFSEKIYNLGIDDTIISKNVDVALKFSQLKEDFERIMNE